MSIGTVPKNADPMMHGIVLRHLNNFLSERSAMLPSPCAIICIGASERKD